MTTGMDENQNTPAGLTSDGRSRWRVWAIVALAGLVTFGAFLYFAVRDELRLSFAHQLRQNVDSRIRVLDEWRDRHLQAVRFAAQDPEVVRLMAAHHGNPEGATIDALWQRLSQLLKLANQTSEEHVTLTGVAAANVDGVVIVAGERRAQGSNLGTLGEEFVARIRDQGAVLSHPMRVAQANDQQPFMLSAAAVLSGDQFLGAVGFRIDPETGFSAVLERSHATQSARTIAFDDQGLMLSRYTGDEALQTMGLLPESAVDGSPMLNLTLREPNTETLVRSVAQAIAGDHGEDVAGYIDHRGVTVVGAWRWLESHNFGIAIEVDQAAAFTTLTTMETWFAATFVLLVIATMIGLFFARRGVNLDRKLRQVRGKLKQLGQYQLVRKLGAGGMGQVFLARHALLRRQVAVKLLLPDRSNDVDRQRFEREVQLTSLLSHPNTIGIYDYGRTTDGRFYYVMEFLEGWTLASLVAANGPLPAARVIHLLRQVCGSLAEAHDVGLVHRDIKPANIMVCERGGVPDRVKVLDFGLVRDLAQREGETLTERNMVAGTPQYLSPEAILDNSSIDGRCDLYSLGAVAYYLLTGRELVQANGSVGWVDQILHVDPAPPSSLMAIKPPADLEKVILHCLRKRPEDRPASARDLDELLAACKDAGKWTEQDGRSAAKKLVAPHTVADVSTNDEAGSVAIELDR